MDESRNRPGERADANPMIRVVLALWSCLSLALACGAGATLPPAALAHNQAGAEALEQGDLEAASAHLELALEYNGDFVEAVANMGLVELSRGNFERARQLLSRARRLNPDIAQPHHGLGVLAEREFRPDVASEHYRAALDVDPGFGASRGNLARLLVQAGYVEHALGHYTKLVRSSPSDVNGFRGLIECLILLGRHDEAAQALGEATRAFASDPGLLLLGARLELHAGRPQHARAACASVLDRGDDYAVSALAWTAIAELVEAKPERAVEHARRALELDAEHPLASYAAAVALDELGDPGAGAWIDRALLLNPGHAELLSRARRYHGQAN